MDLVGRDADTGIGHADADIFFARQALDFHRSSGLGKFDSVREEIQQDLHHRAAVGHDLHVLFRDFRCNADAAFLCAAFHHVDSERNDFGDIQLLQIQLVLSGLDLRHIKDIADEVEQMLAAFADTGNVIEIFRRADGAEQLALHHFRETDDRVQWRAQFMTHIGKELRFSGIGALGGVFGFVQIALVQGALGDILHNAEQGGDVAVFILFALTFAAYIACLAIRVDDAEFHFVIFLLDDRALEGLHHAADIAFMHKGGQCFEARCELVALDAENAIDFIRPGDVVIADRPAPVAHAANRLRFREHLLLFFERDFLFFQRGNVVTDAVDHAAAALLPPFDPVAAAVFRDHAGFEVDDITVCRIVLHQALDRAADRGTVFVADQIEERHIAQRCLVIPQHIGECAVHAGEVTIMRADREHVIRHVQEMLQIVALDGLVDGDIGFRCCLGGNSVIAQNARQG